MTPAENAQLALLLEVAGTPKPGNVDRERDFPDLRFEHFLAGTVGAGRGLRAAEDGAPVGEAFERAVAGMSQQEGGNTQFGALLLLVPLVCAASGARSANDSGRASKRERCNREGRHESERGPPRRETAREVVEATTVADAAGFYRAFDHVSVFVADPPADAAALDVRRGSAAVPAVEERELTLLDVLALGDADDVAREWTSGFERTFAAADRFAALDGSASDRAARVFLELLADRPDTLVAKQHSRERAEAVRERAASALADDDSDGLADSNALDAFAEELVEAGVNPGTTADITAAALFVALERGEVSV